MFSSHIFLLFFPGDLIPVGSVGLAVSQSMVLTMMLQMAARFTADFLGQMTAVERILEYTKLPTEEYIEHGCKNIVLMTRKSHFIQHLPQSSKCLTESLEGSFAFLNMSFRF